MLAVTFVLIWPLSENTYRRINGVALELLLLEIIWLVNWWAGFKNLSRNFEANFDDRVPKCFILPFPTKLQYTEPAQRLMNVKGNCLVITQDIMETMIKMFADHDIVNLMGKEYAILISNHRSDIDWLVGWILAQVFN
ncbi:hypothetical protein GQ457_03G021210 [Hibiscus cannabinus]